MQVFRELFHSLVLLDDKKPLQRVLSSFLCISIFLVDFF
ncbi:hypothetical protein CP10139811_0368 [Chlamydia ibidis]|uniref:Uncharacterized protein n=1 Tax=Chlamydia ibidis TaxID=1405396 RepID=S7J1S1_9CHLA|nr:hypothetical protein CP10139811_0368 [Chlamydia ibidis]